MRIFKRFGLYVLGIVMTVILASAAVGIGGSLLLDIAHKKDSEK